MKTGYREGNQGILSWRPHPNLQPTSSINYQPFLLSVLNVPGPVVPLMLIILAVSTKYSQSTKLWAITTGLLFKSLSSAVVCYTAISNQNSWLLLTVLENLKNKTTGWGFKFSMQDIARESVSMTNLIEGGYKNQMPSPILWAAQNLTWME